MIYLVRHTTPDISPGVCYGQSEVPLTASYRVELTVIRRQLPIKAICFSSPFARCQRLAYDLYGDQVQTDQRLVELNFGAWELKRWDQIDQKAATYWGDHFVTQAPPGGESFKQLQRRVLDFWQTVPRDQDTVIVTHAGVIRAILAHQHNLPLAKAFNLPVSYGQIISIGAV